MSPSQRVFSPDGKLIVAAGLDGTAKIWAARTGRLLHTLPGAGSATFSPAGWLVLTTDGADTRIWSAGTGRLLRTLRHVRPAGAAADGTDAVFSRDGKL